MFNITDRIEFILAKVAGREVDLETLNPPAPINAVEELLLEIAEKLNSEEEEEEEEDKDPK